MQFNPTTLPTTEEDDDLVALINVTIREAEVMRLCNEARRLRAEAIEAFKYEDGR